MVNVVDVKTETETLRRTRDRMFIHFVGLELGIIPLENISDDMRQGLEKLTPEEARKMKRKFRKLWRKYAKEEMHSATSYKKRKLTQLYGIGKHQPSRSQKRARKELVKRKLWQIYIKPAIQKFDPLNQEPGPSTFNF